MNFENVIEDHLTHIVVIQAGRNRLLSIYTNVLFITPPNATKAYDFHTELVAM